MPASAPTNHENEHACSIMRQIQYACGPIVPVLQAFDSSWQGNDHKSNKKRTKVACAIYDRIQHKEGLANPALMFNKRLRECRLDEHTFRPGSYFDVMSYEEYSRLRQALIYLNARWGADFACTRSEITPLLGRAALDMRFARTYLLCEEFIAKELPKADPLPPGPELERRKAPKKPKNHEPMLLNPLTVLAGQDCVERAPQTMGIAEELSRNLWLNRTLVAPHVLAGRLLLMPDNGELMLAGIPLLDERIWQVRE